MYSVRGSKMFRAWFLAACCLSQTVSASEQFIIVQSTTSTKNSGLLDHLIPKFREKTGIDVRVVAVGTGQALKNARNGDGDVLLVHAKPAEEQFVANGYGVERFDIMYNDFVIVGPKPDPAKVKGSKDAPQALARIANTKSIFVSRGDDSGTHKKERALWTLAYIDVEGSPGSWYRETGSGMGATLNVAAGMNAYALTDRATWIAFGNKGDLEIVVEGDQRLFNQYGVILVNPAKHTHVKVKQGQAFLNWLRGSKGQAAIAEFKVSGQQLFIPNAKSSQ